MFNKNKFRGVLLDLDGVVYRGDQLLPGVLSFFDWVSDQRLDYALITNNSTRTPVQIAEKLANLGVYVPSERIVTSAIATARYLSEHANPGARIYVIGEIGLQTALVSCGFELTEDDPEYVVVGLDRAFHTGKLEIAVKAIRKGAIFIATNTDPNLATEKGLEPGTGALVAMVVSETNSEPVVIGKPGAWLFEAAIKKLQSAPSKLVMVGDNIETDIRGAQAVGLGTVLVLTGITTQSDLVKSEIKPDLIVDNLNQLIKRWSS